MRKVIFDTDPGIDDAMALALIQASPDLDLIGVTTNFGNADVETTTRNALFLAQQFGVTAPIYRGEDQPMGGVRGDSPVHIHGADGLGDSGRLPAPGGRIEAKSASQFIIDALRAHPGEITLIAVAPLTNLGRALARAPDIAELAKDVIVMGGAFGWGERRGNVTPVAEANIYNDPVAADAVVAASWPVTMIGLDVTSRCVITNDQSAALARDAGAAGQLLHAISRGYAAIYKTFDGIDGCCLHDVAAVAYAIDPSLFKTVSGPMRVVTEGIAVGQTIQRMPGRTFPRGAWSNLPDQRAAREVDSDAVTRMLIDGVMALSMQTPARA